MSERAPHASAAPADTASWSRFWVIWGTQTGSMSGQGLTNFALGVWVFLQTGSATQFALLEVISVLPTLLLLPVVGVLTDRLGPRRGLLFADGGGLLVGLVLAAVFARKVATPGLLLALLMLRSIVTCTHWPAYTAATTLLVGPARAARAGALMQLGYVGRQVLAPTLAGALMGALGVAGIIALDVATFALALLATASVSFPRPALPSEKPWREQLAEAIAAIRGSGLLRLAGYTVVTYLPGGFVIALATPLALSIASAQTAGYVVSATATGMLVGSGVATRFVRSGGGFSRMLRYDALMAAAMLGVAFAHTPVLLGALGFLFLFGLAGLLAEEQALWQTRIAVAAQGRVFALRRLLTWASLPVSYALAGPLADYVFEPLLRGATYRASPLSGLFGSAPGRGMALLLACGGVVKAVTVCVGARDRALGKLDTAP